MNTKTSLYRKKQSCITRKSTQYSEDLRSRPTKAELEMCRLLDAEKISYVFQSSVYDVESGKLYIADFRIKRCPPARPSGTPRREWQRDTRRLLVEIDGAYHEQQKDYDARRTAWMESKKDAIVLRFSNSDVFDRPAEVIAAIEQYSPVRKTVNISPTSPHRKHQARCTPRSSSNSPYARTVSRLASIRLSS